MDSIKLSREEMYKLVWATPMRRLAERFGVSDVALHKVCKRFEIPKPGLGYWAKIQAGHDPPPRPPLLPLKKRVFPPEITIQPWPEPPPEEPLPDVPEVRVSRSLRNPHPVTEGLKQLLDEAPVDYRHMTLVGGKYGPRIHVGIETRPRVLRLVDALFKATTKQGAEPYLLGDSTEPTIGVLMAGERLWLIIEEKFKRVGYDPKLDRARGIPPTRQYPGNWSYIMTGDLTVTLGHASDVCKADDREGAVLTFLVASLGRSARRAKEYREQWERKEAERQEQERLRQLEEARDEHRKKMMDRLRTVVDRWRQVEDMRAFLRAVDTRLPAEKRSPKVRDWLAWVRRVADGSDPLADPEAMAMELEPDEAGVDALPTP